MRLYSFLVALIILVSCANKVQKSEPVIKIKGSDTMIILVKKWAEAFMVLNPGISVHVDGGGSATGFKALIEGDVDIAMASRVITNEEASLMASTYKSIGVSYLVAKDALSIYLHPDNKIETLSSNDLALIFSGEMKNWLIFTNTLQDIIPVIRPPSSGTYLYFKNHVLKDSLYSKNSVSLPTTLDVVHFVSRNSNAIGYGGIAYGDSLFHAPVDGVYPTEKNIIDGTYPLSRYLYFYTVDKPRPVVKRFIDWVVSPAGQHIVRQVGYIPLWDK